MARLLFLLAALTAAVAANAGEPERRSIAYSTKTMGTYARVVLVATDSVASEPVVQDAQRAFAWVDSLMSNWTQISEVAHLNREATGTTTRVHPEVATVLARALDVCRASDGAFDVTVEPLVRAWGFIGGPRRVPSDEEVKAAFAHVGTHKLRFDPKARTLRFSEAGVKIDLGGIAKGYGVDAAARALQNCGVHDALVDLSGNMIAIGHPADSEFWRIGVRDPRDRMPYFARFQLLPGQAVATSGKYEQFIAANGKTYGHIMDPRTGRPSEGLIAVTVLAPTAMDADAWGTALFVLGPEAAKRKAKERSDLAAILIEPGADGVDTVWIEKSLEGRFTLEPEARELFRIATF